MPQPNQLHEAFDRKNHDETRVDFLEDVGEFACHVVMFHCHSDHVHHYNDHNDDVKLLIRCDVIHDVARKPLK